MCSYRWRTLQDRQSLSDRRPDLLQLQLLTRQIVRELLCGRGRRRLVHECVGGEDGRRGRKEEGRETDEESSQLCTGKVCKLRRRAKYSHSRAKDLRMSDEREMNHPSPFHFLTMRANYNPVTLLMTTLRRTTLKQTGARTTPFIWDRRADHSMQNAKRREGCQGKTITTYYVRRLLDIWHIARIKCKQLYLKTVLCISHSSEL